MQFGPSTPRPGFPRIRGLGRFSYYGIFLMLFRAGLPGSGPYPLAPAEEKLVDVVVSVLRVLSDFSVPSFLFEFICV